MISVLAGLVGTGLLYAIVYIATSSLAIALSAVGLLIVLGLTFCWMWRYYKACDLLGIESSSLRSKEDWDKYYSISRSIRVLFVRGGGVLGATTDPMYINVSKLRPDWGGEIRVLILSPSSQFIADRAHELNLAEEDVKEECRRVMKNIQNLRKIYGVNIKGKYYNSKLFLRFTLFDDFGFFSYPAWGQKYQPYPYHFKIKRKTGQKSLYEALSVYFEQLWRTAEEES